MAIEHFRLTGMLIVSSLCFFVILYLFLRTRKIEQKTKKDEFLQKITHRYPKEDILVKDKEYWVSFFADGSILYSDWRTNKKHLWSQKKCLGQFEGESRLGALKTVLSLPRLKENLDSSKLGI
jgi:hypothetical protein